MIGPRSRASAASIVVGACAAIVVAMAVVFFSTASQKVFGSAGRRFVLAIVAIVGLPYALILLATLTGRIAAASLMTISAASVYLLLAGWPAMFLFIMSWEKTSVDSLPFAAGIVQLIALIAASFARRRLASAERAVPFAPVVFALPLVLAGGLGAYAYQAFAVAKEVPAVRATGDAVMEAHFVKLSECLLAWASAHGGEAPSDTRALDGNCSEVIKRIESQANYRIQYSRVPPGADGRHERFTLCLQPTRVPDSGLVTFLSDDRGMIAMERADVHTRDAVPCSQAIANTPTGLAKRFEHCLAQYWVALGRREYPVTLDPIRQSLPGCLEDQPPPSANDRSRVVQVQIAYGVNARLRYTPTPPGEGEPGYWLYLHCDGTNAFAVIDARGVILNADLPEAFAWLNRCQDADQVDGVALARAAGLRLPEGLVDEPRNALATPPAPPKAPEFFGEPDLAARRAECGAQASACAGLGRELERAINRAGGTIRRAKTLNDETREWLSEARTAHVRACKAGVAQSCHSEASLASYDHDRDASHVEEFYLLGCDGGYELSCSYLAEIYGRGMASTVPGIRSTRLAGQPEIRTPTGIDDPKRPVVAKNLARAAEFYRRACELGNREGCRLEGMTLEESAGNSKDPAMAARANVIFARQCHRSDRSSCLFLTRNAAAAGGMIAGKSTEYWRTHTCLFGGEEYCEPGPGRTPQP